MSIYTRKGDKGKTSDLSGREVSKNSAVIHFIGAADELNCHLGLIKAMILNEDAWQFSAKSTGIFLERVQKNISLLMSHVSDVKNSNFFLPEDEIIDMEKEIDRLYANLPKQKTLIIPGKNIIEAQIQIGRTIARRAESLFFAVKEVQPLRPEAGAYLNRLSDYLFVLSQQESLINVNFINEVTGI
ncbi:MAG: cob(I)yrinic acid a,c-diamide adenosyltransferase [Spirochaetes bacterium]|nr:cob(I)yrinic acid a,c-diamide adenosyltransferase [Spirochaetota bacterium]